jgi:hypothetical protein
VTYRNRVRSRAAESLEAPKRQFKCCQLFFHSRSTVGSNTVHKLFDLRYRYRYRFLSVLAVHCSGPCHIINNDQVSAKKWSFFIFILNSVKEFYRHNALTVFDVQARKSCKILARLIGQFKQKRVSIYTVGGSVSDPHLLYVDPDPAS